MVIVTLRHSRCFENGNDDFGVEAFWAIYGSKRFNFTDSWSATHVLLSFVCPLFFTKNRKFAAGNSPQ